MLLAAVPMLCPLCVQRCLGQELGVLSSPLLPRITPLPQRLQVEMEFPNKQQQDGVVYTFTAVAWNEFGHSKPSPPKAFKTPRRPDPPTVDLVELLAPTDGEPYGSLAVTVTDPLDSGFLGEWVAMRLAGRLWLAGTSTTCARHATPRSD